MGRVFDASDFADSAPQTQRVFDASDFQDESSAASPIQAAISKTLSMDLDAAKGIGKGLALIPPAEDASLTERAGNWVGQNVPSAIGAAATGAAGAAVGIPGGPAGIVAGAMGGAALGGGAVRAAQQGLNAGFNRDTYDPIAGLKDVGQTAVLQGATEGAGRLAIGAAAKYGPSVYDYLATSKAGGGIAKPAWQFFKDNVERVMNYVGKGPEAADEIANDLRTAISNASQELEDAYSASVKELQKTSPYKVQIDQAIGGDLHRIAKEAGYLDPRRNMGTPEAKFFQANITDRVANLRYASPQEIYDFQKDLNRYITDKIGTSLGSDLLKVKNVVRGLIDEHPSLKPIAEMNAAWSDAKTIDAAAQKLDRSNDFVGTIKRVFANPQDTLEKRSLDRISAMVPEAGEQISNLRATQAAQAVAPLFRSATGTGAETGAALVGLGAYAVQHPAALLAAPALPFFSPRAYALGYQLAPRAAVAAGKAAPALSVAGRAAAESLFGQAQQVMSPESIAAFYRSPGAP